MKFSRTVTVRVWAAVGFLLAGFVMAAPSARSQAVQIANVNLSYPVTNFSLTAVNDSQWITGNFTTTSEGTVGMLNVPGSPTQRLIFPGSVLFTRANGINNSGTIVGDFFGQDGVYHGYIYDGSFGDAWNLPGFNEKSNKFSTSLLGISNGGGNLAGATGVGSNVEGFVMIGASLYKFYAQPNANTYVVAVNDAGAAVGQYFQSNTSYCFLWTASGGAQTVLVPGATWTTCTGINNNALITGEYVDGSGFMRGFTYQSGNQGSQPITNDLIVSSVSNLGYMVGTYLAPGGKAKGFLEWPQQPQGNPAPIMAPDAQSTSVYGIDVQGNLVGQYIDSDGVSHGMLLAANGALTTLDNPDASDDSTVCQAVDSDDDVACNYTDSNGNSHASTYNSDRNLWTETSVPGGSQVIVYGVTRAPWTAGTYVDSSGNQHGFALNDGREKRFFQLDAPGASWTVATGINLSEEVVAFWGDSMGYVESSVAGKDGYLNDWVTQNLPGATNCYIGGIDDQGDLTYTWTDPEGNIHAGYYIAAAGKYYLWDDPRGTGTRAYGIVFQPRTNGPVMVGRYLTTASGSDFTSYQTNAVAY